MVDAKENGKAVRNGLDFLRFVAEEYSRLEVYNGISPLQRKVLTH